ncbi:MAG TPA: hypothetical protein VGI16_11575 [Candidatus Acidoferrum sp.]|jgi:hypothetical protein
MDCPERDTLLRRYARAVAEYNTASERFASLPNHHDGFMKAGEDAVAARRVAIDAKTELENHCDQHNCHR